MNATSFGRLTIVGAFACLGVLGYSSPAAFGSAVRIDPTGHGMDLGPSPSGVPANCPFSNGDASVTFTSGSGVKHETDNKNGGWGGLTAQGSGVFSEDGTALYHGHLVVWFGGGGNTQGQQEFGTTINFTGTGLSNSAQTLSLHVSFGGAIPAHSTTPTANHLSVHMVCH
jgi:hypothetical protein